VAPEQITPVTQDPISLLSDTRRPTIRISGVEGPPPVTPDAISMLSAARQPTIRISGVEEPPPVTPAPISLLSARPDFPEWSDRRRSPWKNPSLSLN
jgi:hypothetical protein